MKRVMYIGTSLSLCMFSALGASNMALGLTGSTDFAALACVAAFVGNLFMMEPIRSPIIK